MMLMIAVQGVRILLSHKLCYALDRGKAKDGGKHFWLAGG